MKNIFWHISAPFGNWSVCFWLKVSVLVLDLYAKFGLEIVQNNCLNEIVFLKKIQILIYFLQPNQSEIGQKKNLLISRGLDQSCVQRTDSWVSACGLTFVLKWEKFVKKNSSRISETTMKLGKVKYPSGSSWKMITMLWPEFWFSL